MSGKNTAQNIHEYVVQYLSRYQLNGQRSIDGWQASFSWFPFTA